MRRACFCLLFLVATAAAAAPQKRRLATVLYATQERLYLNAGTADGLASGQTLQLQRDGRPSGTCKVDQVSEHRATCVGTAKVGDAFFVTPPDAAAEAPAKRLPPLDSAQAMARRRGALEAAAFDKVEYHAPPEAIRPPAATVMLSHASWLSSGIGPWHQERADVSLRGVSLGKGFTLDAELSARRWSLRSGAVSFRPEDPTQLYVWEAAISRRPVESGFAMSVGRVRPRRVPGQILFDGGQAGWHSAGGNEAGLFGGVIPDEATLAPSLQHGTFGAYWAGRYDGDASSTVRFFRHELRVAFVNTAELGRRTEAEALMQLSLARVLDVSGDLRVGRGDNQAPSFVDAVRVDGNLQPLENLSLSGGFRYEALSVPEIDGPGTIGRGGASRHANLTAAWDPAEAFRVSVLGGVATDLVNHVSRRWAGPEIGSPRLFGGGAGVAAGYLEEDGWAKGRSAYLQLNAGLRSRLQVFLRFAWYHTTDGLAPEPTDDLAAFASVRAELSRFVWLRLSGMARSSLNGGRKVVGGPSTQAGFIDADLAGEF